MHAGYSRNFYYNLNTGVARIGFHCIYTFKYIYIYIFVSFHLGMYTDGVYILLTALHYSEWRHRGGSIEWLAGQTLWESWRGGYWRRAKRVYSREAIPPISVRLMVGNFGIMMEWSRWGGGEEKEREKENESPNGVAAQDGWRVRGETVESTQ